MMASKYVPGFVWLRTKSSDATHFLKASCCVISDNHFYTAGFLRLKCHQTKRFKEADDTLDGIQASKTYFHDQLGAAVSFVFSREKFDRLIYFLSQFSR